MELIRGLTFDEESQLLLWAGSKLGEIDCPFNRSCEGIEPYCKELIKDYPDTELCPCDIFRYEEMVEFAKEVLRFK